jgi:hypothetical protein
VGVDDADLRRVRRLLRLRGAAILVVQVGFRQILLEHVVVVARRFLQVAQNEEVVA